MNIDKILTIAALILLIALAYKVVPPHRHKNRFMILAYIAVLLRIITVIYIYHGRTDSFGTDGLLYHKEGIRVAQQLAEGVPLYAVKYSYTLYTAFIGLIYYIFGVSRYIVSFINIVLTLYAAVILLKIGLNHKLEYANAVFISLVFLYFPNLILWTADSRKEALLIFVCFLYWYLVQRFCIKAEYEKRPGISQIPYIVFICVLIWLCTLIRIYMFVPLSVGILVSQVLLYSKTRRLMCLVFAAVVVTSGFLIFFSTVYPLLGGYHAISFPDETGNLFDDIARKLETVKYLASGRNILVTVLRYIILPFPGNLNIPDIEGTEALQLVVGIDMFAWYICLIFMIAGIYHAVKEKESLYMGILAFLAAYILINVLVVENKPDTIYRYRSAIVGLSLLFIDWNAIRDLLKRFHDILKMEGINKESDIITSYGIKHNT